MKKYIAIIDWKAGYGGYDAETLDAKSLEAAMTEAERYNNPDTVYCTFIAVKDGKMTRNKDEGTTQQTYRSVIFSHGDGWEPCDAEHGRPAHAWMYTQWHDVDAIEPTDF